MGTYHILQDALLVIPCDAPRSAVLGALYSAVLATTLDLAKSFSVVQVSPAMIELGLGGVQAEQYDLARRGPISVESGINTLCSHLVAPYPRSRR